MIWVILFLLVIFIGLIVFCHGLIYDNTGTEFVGLMLMLAGFIKIWYQAGAIA